MGQKKDSQFLRSYFKGGSRMSREIRERLSLLKGLDQDENLKKGSFILKSGKMFLPWEHETIIEKSILFSKKPLTWNEIKVFLEKDWKKIEHILDEVPIFSSGLLQDPNIVTSSFVIETPNIFILKIKDLFYLVNTQGGSNIRYIIELLNY